MIHPNWVAYLALLIWPVVGIYLYGTFPIGKATLWTILGGFLLLPVGTEIKISGIPAFDKSSIPNLTALLLSSVCAARLPKVFRGFGIAEALITVMLVGPFITSMLNSDPIRIGITYLPGVGPYDALSAAAAQFIFMIPFFLGRQFLRNQNDNAEILRVLVIAGLTYSLPVLFEIRMSPQLHFWIYGYMPTDFIQEVRDGGFRPVVFLGHGLLLAFFMMSTTVASAALWRTRYRIADYFSAGAIIGYLSVVLLLCKTASAAVYAVLLVPLVRWATPRMQFRIATLLVCIALAYPLLRANHLVPTTRLLEAANSLSADRAQSLRTRFENEDELLVRAWQRPWFGWGRFGRNRVYNGWNGGDSSITDGYWIITIGQFGIIGFLAQFGLLGLTVFQAATTLKFAEIRYEAEYLSALALIVAIGMIDLIPNSSIRPWTWLLAGALLGRAEALKRLSGKHATHENVLSPTPTRPLRPPTTKKAPAAAP
jgi:hypothetical protein